MATSTQSCIHTHNGVNQVRPFKKVTGTGYRNGAPPRGLQPRHGPAQSCGRREWGKPKQQAGFILGGQREQQAVRVVSEAQTRRQNLQERNSEEEKRTACVWGPAPTPTGCRVIPPTDNSDSHSTKTQFPLICHCGWYLLSPSPRLRTNVLFSPTGLANDGACHHLRGDVTGRQ